MDVITKVEFDNLFTFIYSKREGTPAEKMDDPIAHEEKAKWMGELLETQEKITSRRMSAYVGKTQRVLCEICDGDYVSGRTDSNIVVRFKGGEGLVGEFADVKITESHRSMLTGVLAD